MEERDNLRLNNDWMLKVNYLGPSLKRYWWRIVKLSLIISFSSGTIFMRYKERGCAYFS